MQALYKHNTYPDPTKKLAAVRKFRDARVTKWGSRNCDLYKENVGGKGYRNK